jgi:hypothetical protein
MSGRKPLCSGQDIVKSIIPTLDGGYVIGGTSSSDMSQKIHQGLPDPYEK